MVLYSIEVCVSLLKSVESNELTILISFIRVDFLLLVDNLKLQPVLVVVVLRAHSELASLSDDVLFEASRVNCVLNSH